MGKIIFMMIIWLNLILWFSQLQPRYNLNCMFWNNFNCSAIQSISRNEELCSHTGLLIAISSLNRAFNKSIFSIDIRTKVLVNPVDCLLSPVSINGVSSI